MYARNCLTETSDVRCTGFHRTKTYLDGRNCKYADKLVFSNCLHSAVTVTYGQRGRDQLFMVMLRIGSNGSETGITSYHSICFKNRLSKPRR